MYVTYSRRYYQGRSSLATHVGCPVFDSNPPDDGARRTHTLSSASFLSRPPRLSLRREPSLVRPRFALNVESRSLGSLFGLRMIEAPSTLHNHFTFPVLPTVSGPITHAQAVRFPFSWEEF